MKSREINLYMRDAFKIYWASGEHRMKIYEQMNIEVRTQVRNILEFNSNVFKPVYDYNQLIQTITNNYGLRTLSN